MTATMAAGTDRMGRRLFASTVGQIYHALRNGPFHNIERLESLPNRPEEKSVGIQAPPSPRQPGVYWKKLPLGRFVFAPPKMSWKRHFRLQRRFEGRHPRTKNNCVIRWNPYVNKEWDESERASELLREEMIANNWRVSIPRRS